MAIKELSYVIVETADPAAWDRYLTHVVGVMSAGQSADGAALYRIDDRPFRFRIVRSHADCLAAAGYEMDSRASLDALAERIEQASQPVQWGDAAACAARSVEAFFATSDPAGNGLEFCCGAARDDVAFVSPKGVSGFVTGDMGMGHAVFAAPDFDAMHGFYHDVVGFHDTDMPEFKFSPDQTGPGMRFAFMHADNARHHAVAFGEMPQVPPRCIHLMLQMENLSDVGKCHDRMRMANVPESATLGRHVNDETLGFYMQTPSGFDLEIGCDSLQIDPANWEATAHAMPSEWGHVWAWQNAMEEAQKAEAAE
ncbi:MAG: VOC family protein [Sphingomonadaceae bacterium]|nr:VOC family protein [Sphingomonadaceae bacterium]